MDLHEYQGKQVFRRFGIPVSEGRLATTPEEARQAAEELGGPVVVKAQVLTGGRGKAGGVKLAVDPADAEQKAREILGLDTLKRVATSDVPSPRCRPASWLSTTKLSLAPP